MKALEAARGCESGVAGAGDRDRNAQHRKHDAFERTTLAIAIVGVIVLCAYTGITGYQANIARDTEQRQLRAYMSATAKSVENFNTNKPIVVRLLIKNFGQTPAYHVQICGWGIIIPYPVAPNAYFAECDYVAESGSLTLFPQAEYNPYVDNIGPFKPFDAALVADGTRARLGVYGTVHYI